MSFSPPCEGKIDVFAQFDGLFRVDAARLHAINAIEGIMAATRHDLFLGARRRQIVRNPRDPAGHRGGEDRPGRARRWAGADSVAARLPADEGGHRHHRRGGILRPHRGHITPVVVEKLRAYGIEAAFFERTDDKKRNIVDAIARVRAAGAQIVLCTGGMSVDPDDRTPAAIRDSGASIVTYGAPVLPGAMFLLGYYADGVPVMGLPGCVMYADATVFDILLPRVAAGLRVEKQDIVRLGPGGLGLGCKPCHYPACSFGKFA